MNDDKARSKMHTTTVRLPADMALDAEVVARVDGVPMSRLMNDAIAEHIKQRRADPEFQQRLRDRIAADQKILDRLAEE